MSEQENNICAICGNPVKIFRGGWLDPTSQAYRDLAKQAWRDDARLICLGHPETAEKHNGRLDDRLATHDYHADVELQEDYGMCDGSRVVVIAGGRGDCENSRILLEPAQALSLLDWLLQERDELTRLAKEQKQ